jgi:DNA processing protein
MGLVDIIAKKLLIHFGTAKAVFRAKKKQLEKTECIGKYLINSILSTDALTRTEQELKWIEQEGINHLFYAKISNAFEAM